MLSVLHKGFLAPPTRFHKELLNSEELPTQLLFSLSSQLPWHLLFFLLEASFASEPAPRYSLFMVTSTLEDCFPSSTIDDCQPHISSPGFRLNSQLPITSQNFPVKYIQFPTFQIELTVFLTYFFMIPSLVSNTPSKHTPPPLLELETDWNAPFPSHLHIPLKSGLADLLSSTSLSPSSFWSWF